MAQFVWVTLGVAAAAALGWRIRRRLSEPPPFAPGSLRRQYERCRDLFRLNPFEVDNILNSIALWDEYRISGQRYRKDDVILDVGAHVGVFSFLCHQKGSRSIYAYEPSPQNFARLREYVASLPGVHCTQAAVWRSDTAASGTLLLSRRADENTGGNSVLMGGQAIEFHEQRTLPAAGDADPVPFIALDAILERFDRVKLLKLDCEGSEFPILLTSARLGRVERIVGEVHECLEEVTGQMSPEARVAGHTSYRAKDLAHRLESFGFHVLLQPTSGNLWLFDARRTAG